MKNYQYAKDSIYDFTNVQNGGKNKQCRKLLRSTLKGGNLNLKGSDLKKNHNFFIEIEGIVNFGASIQPKVGHFFFVKNGKWDRIPTNFKPRIKFSLKETFMRVF